MQYNCSTCLFSQEKTDINQIGKGVLICRRYPPTAHVLAAQQGIATVVGHVTVSADILCGEYRPATDNPRDDRHPLTSGATALFLARENPDDAENS